MERTNIQPISNEYLNKVVINLLKYSHIDFYKALEILQCHNEISSMYIVSHLFNKQYNMYGNKCNEWNEYWDVEIMPSISDKEFSLTYQFTVINENNNRSSDELIDYITKEFFNNNWLKSLLSINIPHYIDKPSMSILIDWENWLDNYKKGYCASFDVVFSYKWDNFISIYYDQKFPINTLDVQRNSLYMLLNYIAFGNRKSDRYYCDDFGDIDNLIIVPNYDYKKESIEWAIYTTNEAVIRFFYESPLWKDTTNLLLIQKGRNAFEMGLYGNFQLEDKEAKEALTDLLDLEFFSKFLDQLEK